ncbi:MAG TPA: hypothetical protein VM492_02150 [Sumerlaeia bacterium]|nr:hypothetical protein [Sumerlaeia bacterium]
MFPGAATRPENNTLAVGERQSREKRENTRLRQEIPEKTGWRREYEEGYLDFGDPCYYDNSGEGQGFLYDAVYYPNGTVHIEITDATIAFDDIEVGSTWKAWWYNTMTGAQVGDATTVTDSDSDGDIEINVPDIVSDRALVLTKQ